MTMIWLFAVLLIATASGKVYERCELARELRNTYRVTSDKELATWVCIAKFESAFDTSAVGRPNSNGSRDYGLFQINNKYWCSPTGNGCGVPCQELLSDDIHQDVRCIRIIYKQTKRNTGDGFTAWSTYKPHCKIPDVEKYIRGCF